MKLPRIVVYTAITKGYDRLRPPLQLWQREAHFVAFMEEPQPVAGWEIRPIHRRYRDPCRNAKVHKILPHRYFPEAEFSLWIDGCVLLQSALPLSQWVDEYLREHDLALCRHWLRNCIYREALTCMRWNWDSAAVIDRQMQRYFNAGYPFNHGLAECTVILRRHTRAIARFNEAWHDEIRRGSRRDQLSFNFVARELGLQYAHLPGTIRRNPHFLWLPHTARRSLPSASFRS